MAKGNKRNSDGTIRSLSNRHVQMIAIGGTIGTGLFLGSGETIAQTGPSILIVYMILGFFFFLMMRSIGEMLYSDPEKHTFVAFISKYLGKSAGLFSGWTYWLGLIFACMAELTAVATYVQFWFPTIPAWLIEVVFLIVLCGINLIAARLFGEAEFWFSMIKIIAIVALIVTGIFMMILHTRTNVGHASFGNIFNHFQLFPHGPFSFFSAFPMVFFAFLGIESVSITIGESKDPHKVIKKSVNETLIRILIFYVGSLVAIMGIIPWRTLIPSQSPFVDVFKIAGLSTAAGIINFVVLTAAASAINSIIFSAGRHFYQLSSELKPTSFLYRHFVKISKNGVPATSIIISSLFILITPIMSISSEISSLFMMVAGASSDMNIFVYILTLLAHRKYRQSNDFLSDGFKMPGYKLTSPLTILFFIGIYISLLVVPEDTIGAIGSLVWAIGFGGLIYFKERKA